MKLAKTIALYVFMTLGLLAFASAAIGFAAIVGGFAWILAGEFLTWFCKTPMSAELVIGTGCVASFAGAGAFVVFNAIVVAIENRS